MVLEDLSGAISACNRVLTSANGYEHTWPAVLEVVPHNNNIQNGGGSFLSCVRRYLFFNVCKRKMKINIENQVTQDVEAVQKVVATL